MRTGTNSINWKENKKILEVLSRLKRKKKAIFKKTFMGKLFGNANKFKPKQLERLFKKHDVDFYSSCKYLIEDPNKYSNKGWTDTGQRKGYDSGIKLLRRRLPETFWFNRHNNSISRRREYEFKEERNPSQKFVQTIDKNEASSLIDNGYSLTKQNEVYIEYRHCLNHISPSDWPSSIKEETLFTLIHPDATQKDIGKAKIHSSEPKRHVIVTG